MLIYEIDDDCDGIIGPVEADSILNSIKVFPNPAFNSLTITLDNKRQASIEVYNTMGSIIYPSTGMLTGDIILNLVDWPSGVYFLKVQDSYSGKERTIPFIKQLRN